MHSENHTADGNDESDSTEEYGCLMVSKFLTITIGQSIHDKDAIIYTNTENKGGDNDIDQIEAHIKQYHRSQDNQPTEQDRHKAKDGILYIEMETDEQHQEYKQH